MKKIFTNFIGKWILIRKITNLADFKGIANFDLTKANSIFYREDLKINEVNLNYSHNFFKEYIYQYKDNTISKYFTDYNLFYHLEPSTRFKCFNYKGKHYCNQDIYLATYNFVNQNNFILKYEIHGPEKQHVIETNYIRF